MVLFTASRGNTFVGGTCALLSALLVSDYFCIAVIDVGNTSSPLSCIKGNLNQALVSLG